MDFSAIPRNQRYSERVQADCLNLKGRNAMAEVVVMYKTPKDPAAFEKYYAETHVPLAKKMPGLRKFQVSQGPVATPAGPSAFHLIAILTFDNMAAIQKAFGSAE